MLIIPDYIKVAGFRDVPAEYTWSDYNPYKIIGEIDPLIEHRLSRLTYRAILGYSIACAEWVVYRLEGFIEDRRPLEFLEACWAFEMSQDYAMPEESDSAEWKGAVRGAIDLALMTILNTGISIEEGTPETDAAFAELLPLHVLPANNVFVDWRNTILYRLESFYPRTMDEPMGSPVPREAFDPGINLSKEQMLIYVNNFLGAIDENNQFIDRIR